MPELPEVENIRIQLEKYLVGLSRGGALRGHKIKKVEIRYKKCFTGNPKKITGSKIKAIRRFGKALSIDFSNKYSLVIHIKMTGQLIYRGPNLKTPPELSKKITDGVGGKHTHVIFHLDRKGILYYNDVRKFGWIRIIKSADLKTKNEFINTLGPEPIIDPKNPPVNKLTLKKFKDSLSNSGQVIKALLMDQKKMAGIGNIYATDALWLAKIQPTKPANKLSGDQVAKLLRAIEKVLMDGLKKGGASENSFVTPDGAEGNYQKHFYAYGQEGEICPRCKKAKFKKIKVGGRGTTYCPYCQS